MALIFSILFAVITLLFGILILVFPKFLRYAVGIYFIIIGAIALLKIIFGISLGIFI